MSVQFEEKRSSTRYDANSKVVVLAYLDEGKAFKLHTPQDAVLINISTGGVRLGMKPNSLTIDDTVQISLPIGKKQRLLNAQVVNLYNTDESSEYGCQLVDF